MGCTTDARAMPVDQSPTCPVGSASRSHAAAEPSIRRRVTRAMSRAVQIFKANVASHPVMILDRFLAVFAEFLFNDAQLGFEFRPVSSLLLSLPFLSPTSRCPTSRPVRNFFAGKGGAPRPPPPPRTK